MTKHDYTGIYKTIHDFTGLYRTKHDYKGVKGTVSESVSDQPGLGEASASKKY